MGQWDDDSVPAVILAGVNDVCLHAFVVDRCVFVSLSALRSQHASQQQQLVDERGPNNPRRGCGKARNNEEVGSKHLQGIRNVTLRLPCSEVSIV